MSLSSPPPARSRRPRGSLSRELILDAAEEVAQQGFDALTLRAVATRLEAAPMALYRYFATKEELINALLDRVLGRFAPDPPSGDWVDDLRRFARAHRLLLDLHPWALAGLFSHPNPTRIGEVALEILSRAHFGNERVVATFGGLLALNFGWSSIAPARDGYPHIADWCASDRHYALVLEQLLAGVSVAARSELKSLERL